ncbi:helix-turn-helix domain-containing protein [Lewinella sp. LCG006]|uniref:helix-turn-helix domain-containing protein n=1 Tax=Lewinella sp. LCG006 TaxID=3231911 RepID=UPI0034609A4B
MRVLAFSLLFFLIQIEMSAMVSYEIDFGGSVNCETCKSRDKDTGGFTVKFSDYSDDQRYAKQVFSMLGITQGDMSKESNTTYIFMIFLFFSVLGFIFSVSKAKAYAMSLESNIMLYQNNFMLKIERLEKYFEIGVRNMADIATMTKETVSKENDLKLSRFLIVRFDSLNTEMEKFLEKVALIFDENLSDSSFAVNRVKRALLVSEAKLYKDLIYLFGCGFQELLLKYRMRIACEKLMATDDKIEIIAFDVGYENHSSFTRIFKECYGITPSSYRKSKRKY